MENIAAVGHFGFFSESSDLNETLNKKCRLYLMFVVVGSGRGGWVRWGGWDVKGLVRLGYRRLGMIGGIRGGGWCWVG